MKKKSLLLRITVPAVFAVLMSGFIAFRSGAFDGWMPPGETYSDTQTSADSPTTQKADTSLKIDIDIPSTKSGYIFHEEDFQAPKQDTQKKQPPQQNAPAPGKSKNPPPNSNTNPAPNMNNAPIVIPSSKSGPVFVPKPDTAKKPN